MPDKTNINPINRRVFAIHCVAMALREITHMGKPLRRTSVIRFAKAYGSFAKLSRIEIECALNMKLGDIIPPKP